MRFICLGNTTYSASEDRIILRLAEKLRLLYVNEECFKVLPDCIAFGGKKNIPSIKTKVENCL